MAPGDARARKRRRLSRSGEFDRVYRDGSSYANRHVVLYGFPRGGSDDDHIRLGVSASRKVGGAVERNKAKRALREAFWQESDHLPAAHDFVLVARPDLGDLLEAEGGEGARVAVADAISNLKPGKRST